MAGELSVRVSEVEFQGSGKRTLKMMCQAQCFPFLSVALSEILMSFASEPAERGNYLIV